MFSQLLALSTEIPANEKRKQELFKAPRFILDVLENSQGPLTFSRISSPSSLDRVVNYFCQAFSVFTRIHWFNGCKVSSVTQILLDGFPQNLDRGRILAQNGPH